LLLIIVDYPDFNLKLAAFAKQLGVPVLFYISPQVWAWRSKRVTKIGKRVDHMAVIFPFEVPFYENANIPVSYVGHPLIDQINCESSKNDACKALKLDSTKPVVALLPGSRNGPVTLVEDQTQLAVRCANAVVTASGTATLEVALLGTPMAIVYIINKINYAIMKRLIQIDNIGLVNIVSGKRIVQEFVQDQAEPSKIAEEILKILDNPPYRDEMVKELAVVKEKMGDGGASENVAGLITEMLRKP